MDEKKWELANSLTKLLLAGLISGLLLGGSVIMGLCMGFLAYEVEIQGGNGTGKAGLFGLVAGATAYFAGLAGREYANRRMLDRLRPNHKPEVPDAGPKAD